MAEIISGKALAAEIKKSIAAEVAELKKQDVTPCLVVMQIGDDPASSIYVNNKCKMCEELGIKSILIKKDADITEDEVLSEINRLNDDKAINGILVQLPLPSHLNEQKILQTIKPEKDVDGFHILNAGKLMTGQECMVPCTPKGIIKMIESTGMKISGKNAVVIGRSNIVGKPVAMELLKRNATVTICHSRTQNLPEVCAQADILVVSIGKPEFVTNEFIKEGAVVIDVGISRVDGKIKGDVKFDEAEKIASYISPVPGGVGPMTIIMLMENTLTATKNQLV